MGQAKWRKELQKGMDELSKEAQGIWQVSLTPLHTLINERSPLVLSFIEILAKEKYVVCLCCDNKIGPGHHFGPWTVTLSAADDASKKTASLSVICEDCCIRNQGNLIQFAFDAIKRTLIKDARRIEVHPNSGKA